MDEEFNFDINFDFLSESKVTPRDSTPQCRQQNTTFTTESLALRIASVNDLVIQIKNLNEHNLKLQMEVESLSGTAASIKLLYEQEKAINSERELHIEELNQKLEEAKDQLANKLLHCEQISSYMEENKGLVPYNELALRYYRVANKVEETMGLGLKEKTILKEIQNHIESKKLTVLQPLKRKRLKNYKDTAVQCKLPIKSQSIGIQHAVGMMCKSTSTDSEGLNLKSSVEQSTQTLPEDRLKYMVSKGIQYRYSTTTRATNTTNLVTTRSIGTSNTDLTLIDVADILDEMEFTHSPLSPIPISIYDNPMEEKVHTNSIGTNTDLYNVQKPIDYLFERSEPEKPRLPSKSLCSCVKSEMPPFATQCLMHPNNLNSIDFVYTFCRYMLLAMQNNSDLSNPVRKYYGSKKDEKQEENLDTMENTKDYFKPSSPCDPSSNGYLPINENAGNNSKNEMQYDNLINSSPVFLQPQSFENNDIERFFPAENNATFFDNNNYVPEDPLIGSDSVQTSRVDKILRLFPEYTSSKGKRKEIKRILKTSTTKKTRKNNSHSIFEISNDENVFGPYQISLGNEGIPKNPSTQFNNSNKTFENVVLRKETPDISSNTASLEKTHKSNGTLERVFLKKKAAETNTNNTPQLGEPHQNNEYRRKDFKSEQRTEMGELSPTEKSDSVLNNSHVGVTSRIKAKDKYVKNSNYSNSKTLDLHESSPKEKDQRIEHLEATEETSMSPHHIAVTINGNPVQISENTNIVPSNTIKDASTERKTTASPDLDKRQQVGIFKGFGNHKHKIENVDEEEELLFPQNKVSTDIAMQPISHNTSDKNPEYSQMDMAMSLPNEDTFTDNMSKYRASDSVEQGGRSPKDTRKSVPKMTAQQDLNTIQQDEFSRSMRRNVLEDVLNKNDQEINEFARSTASESNCLNGVSPLNCYNLENEKRRNVVDASFSDSFEKSKSTHFDFERTTSETKYQNNCVPVKVAKGEVHLCSSIKSADVRDEPSDGYVQSRSNKDQHFKCLQRSVSHVTENNCCLEREHTFEYTKCKSNRENSLSRYPSAEGKTQSYCPAKKGMDTLISASDEDSNSSEKSLPSETQNMKKFTQPFEFSPKDISDCEFQENEDIFMYKKSTFSLPGTKLLMKASSPVTRINALTFQTLDSKESSICNFSESNFTTKSVISLEIPGDGSEYSSIPPDKSKKSNVTLRDSSQQQHFEPESRNLSKALSIDNPKTLKRKEKRIARIKKLKRRKDSCSENEQHNLVFAEKVTRINNSTKKTSDRDVKNAAVIKSIHSSTSSEEDSNQTAYTPCETGFNGELGELGQEEAQKGMKQAMFSPKVYDINISFKNTPVELEQEEAQHELERVMVPRTSFDKSRPSKRVLEKQNQEEAPREVEQAMISPKCFDIARTFKGRLNELEQKEDVRRGMEQTMLPPKSFDKNIPFKSVLEKGNQEEAQHEMKQAMMSPKGFDKNIPSKSVLEKQIQEEAQHEIELNMISPKSFDIDRTLKGALGEREQEKVLGKLNQEKPYLEIELPMFSPKGIDKDRTLKGALRGQEQEEVLGKLNQEKPHLEIEQRMFTPNGIDKQRAFTSALRELKQMEQAMLSPRSFDINRTFKVTLRKPEQEGADYEMEQPMMLSKVCDINRSFKKTPVELEQENTQHEIERVMVSPNSFDKSRPSKRVLEKHNQKEAHHEMEQSMMSQKGFDIARTIKSRLKELEQKGDVHHEMERSMLLPKGFDKNIKFKSVLEEENQEETQHEMEQDMISKKGLDIARTFKGRLKELEQKEDVHHEMERSLLPPKNFNKYIPFKSVLEKGNQEEAQHEMEQDMISPKGFDIARTFKGRLKELEQKEDAHHEMERSMFSSNSLDKSRPSKSVLEKQNQEEVQHEMEQDMISPKGFDIAGTFKGRLKELEQKEDVHHEMERSMLLPKNVNKNIPFKSVLEKENQVEAQHKMEQAMMSQNGFKINRKFKGSLEQEGVQHEIEQVMFSSNSLSKSRPTKSVLEKQNQQEVQHEMEQDMISPKGFDIDRTLKVALEKLNQEKPPLEVEQHMFSPKGIDIDRTLKGALGEREQEELLGKLNQEKPPLEVEQRMFSPKGIDKQRTFTSALRELKQQEVQQKMEQAMFSPRSLDKNKQFKSVPEKHSQERSHQKIDQALLSPRPFDINRTFRGTLGKLEQKEAQHEMERIMVSPKDFENTPCQMVPFSKKSEINYSTYADDPVQEVVNCTRKIDKRINLESYTRYDALITGALIKTSYTSQISQIKGSSKYFTGSTEAVLNEMSNESDGAQTLKQINTKVVEDPESRCLNKCIVSPKKSCPVESIIIKPTISSEVDLSKRFDKVDQNDFQHSTTCLKTNSMCSLESKSVVNTTLPVETLSSSIYHPKFETHSNVGVSELSNTTGLYVVEQNISTTNASPEHCSSKFTPHKPDQWSNLSLQMNNSSNHYNFSSSSQFSSESESEDQDLEHLDIDSLLEQILEEYNLPSPVSEINDIDEIPHSPDAPKIPKDTKEDAKEKTYPSSNIQPTRSSLRLAAAKQDKLKKYQEEESTNSHLESEIKLPHIKERCNKPHLFNNKKRKSSSPDEITTKRKNSLLQNDLIVPEVQLKALGVELGKYTTLSSGECRKQDKMTKDTTGPSSTKDSYEPDIRLGFFKDSLEGESANEISSDSNLLVTGCKSSKPSFWDELVKQPEEIENTTRVTDTNVLTLSSPQLEHNPAAQETFSLCPFETKESNYAKSNILSSDGSYLAFSESPSSPPLIDQKPEDTHVIRKYFDVPLNFVRSPYKSILSEMIGNHYPDKVNQTTESNSSIIQSLKTVINEYLKEVPEKRNINTTFDNILKVTKIWKCIALGVVHTAVDISRGNSDIPGYYRGPNLDYGLCGLVSLVILLNAKQSKFRQMVLLALDHHLFKLKSEAMSLGSLLNLTQLYLALIANPELGSSPVRLFLCKCLYFYNLKAIPMVNEILEVYPTVLPIWKSLDDRSDALITTIQYILMNTYYDLEKEDLKTRSLYIKLVQKYKYQTLQPTREQVIEHLIAKIRAGCFNNVSYAFAMIGKRIKQQIAEETLLKHLLVPLAQKYYDTMTLTPDNDSRIACVLECISFIIKPFGLNSNMSTYLNLFERFLNACDRQLVQEAALAGIIRLTRFGFVKCFTAAYKFAPNYDLSENMKKMLLSFIYKKNHKFLQNLQRQCEVLDVK